MRAVGPLIALVLTPALEARASGLGRVTEPELAAVATAASEHLLASQLAGGGWAWYAGGQKQGDNFSGLVAEAILAAHEHTGRQDYLRAAEAYARVLTKRFAAKPDLLPFKPDLELLVRLSEVSGDIAWARTAGRWFQVLKRSSPRGALEVQRIMRGRESSPNIVGFDVALGIRAALAVEEYDYARELADTVLAHRAAWLRDPSKTFGTISRAALLDALVMLDKRAYRAAIDELAGGLIREQEANGSWCQNETQATAYVVRAFARLGEAIAAGAARSGSSWLAATLLPRGRWAHFNDGMPEPFVGDILSEVQAEALTSIILASHL